MKKVKGFTLMELLVGMVISALVISFGYQAFHLIGKQFSSYRSAKKELNERELFQSVFSRDLASSYTARKIQNQIDLALDSSRIEYKFEDEFILRNTNLSKDTFYLPVREMSTGAADFDLTDTLIRMIKLRLLVNQEEQFLEFRKEYDSKTLIKATGK